MRWLALTGQTLAIVIVYFGLGLDLPLIPAMAVVLLSGALNVVVALVRAEPAWLGSREGSAMLGFDLVQLAILLSLTGGLSNPFSLLMLAPVAVAAWALPRPYALGLAILAIVLVTILTHIFLPLPGGATILRAGPHFILGVWAALVISILFIAGYVALTAREAGRMTEALAAAELALEREQTAAALGALAAAAAHELGSPLSTIAVIAEDLEAQIAAGNNAEEDLALLRAESARCHEILARLSRHPTGSVAPREDIPLTALIEEAAAPFSETGPLINLTAKPLEEEGTPPPLAHPNAWVVQGLRTLIQNAVQFADEEVELLWDWRGSEVTLLVRDDGPGFDLSTIARMGEPYYSTGAAGRRHAEEGPHMGLGVFIARTLLIASGAQIAFRNHAGGGGEVTIFWATGVLDPLSQPHPGV